MKTWKLNLYNEYFEKTKKGEKLWECRRDTSQYSIFDEIEFTNKNTGEKLFCVIIDVWKTETIYKSTNLVILTLKIKRNGIDMEWPINTEEKPKNA